MMSPGDGVDAFAVDVAGHHAHPEGHVGQDGGLGCSVETLHVGGGVALGVPEALRLCQRFVVGGAASVMRLRM